MSAAVGKIPRWRKLCRSRSVHDSAAPVNSVTASLFHMPVILIHSIPFTRALLVVEYMKCIGTFSQPPSYKPDLFPILPLRIIVWILCKSSLFLLGRKQRISNRNIRCLSFSIRRRPLPFICSCTAKIWDAQERSIQDDLWFCARLHERRILQIMLHPRFLRHRPR